MYKKQYFEGFYFKHQNNTQTVSIIPSISSKHAWIQIITDDNSYYVAFPKKLFYKDGYLRIQHNLFSTNGIIINIDTKNLKMTGKLNYHHLTPLKYDIMGPFKSLPMQCRHGVISMHHIVNGKLNINDKMYNFVSANGYIEKDSGCSFPKKYAWIQSNDFNKKCSIMAAIADIPFFGFSFNGLISVIYYKGREYRITTYNGGQIIKCNKNMIHIKNKKLQLKIYISNHNALCLKSPTKGKMIGIVKESPSCMARFIFYENEKLIFDFNSPKSSFEFVF